MIPFLGILDISETFLSKAVNLSPQNLKTGSSPGLKDLPGGLFRIEARTGSRAKSPCPGWSSDLA